MEVNELLHSVLLLRVVMEVSREVHFFSSVALYNTVLLSLQALHFHVTFIQAVFFHPFFLFLLQSSIV